MEEILKKLPEENESQYIWKVGQAKDAGLVTETWEQLAPRLNIELGIDDTEWRGESAFRKKYRVMQQAYDDVFSKKQFAEEHKDKISDATKELYIAKKQFEDQRRECRKFWTSEARFEHLTNKIIESVNFLCEQQPLAFNDFYIGESYKDAVLCMADFHYGMITENIWNKYNTDICRRRVQELINKTIRYLQLHDVRTLHVLLLGDAAHGAIHASARVASEEDVCDQIINVSEIIAEAINTLSQYVQTVNIYATYGNHLRTVQNKNDSIHSDNMEKLIPWWLKQRLRDNPKISIIENEYYEFIYLNVLGYDIVAAHGDLEKFKNFGVTVNTLFSKKYGRTIDYTISADKHHIEEFESLGIESILTRSLCGTDEYSNNNRLYSAPGQTLMIFSSSEGRECTYNIKLD
nr:MAG TPA: DNA polymerase II small subunit [Caudoviricetes sp.]